MTVTINGTTGIDKVQTTATSGQVIELNGIKFPATQSASSDANTLDDYEEGSFTPVLNFGGGTTGITYVYQKGYYAKIGKNVFVNIYVYLSNKGSSSGSAQITGLPFTTSGTTGLGDLYIPVAQRNQITSTYPVFVYASNATSLSFYSTSLSGGSPNGLTESAFGNNTEFNIQLWYQTSA